MNDNSPKYFRLTLFRIFSLVTTLIFPLVSQAAPQKFVRSADKVEGKYIVVLDDVEPSSSNILDLVTSEAALTFGASVEETYSSVLQGFSAQLEEQQAIALSNDPRVKFVIEDAMVSLSPLERRKGKKRKRRRKKRAQWDLDRLDAPFLPLDKVYRPIGTGEGVNVYVVDTGIRLTHKEFQGRARLGVNTTPYPFNGDCNGHGTHVAGTIGGKTHGVAKKANLIAVKVAGRGCSSLGSISWILAGLDWIARNAQRPAVVNMSFGRQDSDRELLAWDLAVRNLISQGITVVLAAGNDNQPVEIYSPARVREAIVVGASTDGDQKAQFSNWGRGVDVFAPGVAIESASDESDRETAERLGTSMAAPHVTGFVALLLQKNPSLTPTRIENIVKHHATKGLVGGLENFPGTPNRLLSIRHVPDLTDFAKLDPYFYLNMNPDVSAAVGGVENFAGGAAQWEAQGKSEGRMSSPAHWPEYYFTLYEDLANFFGHNAWAAAHDHWYHSGRAEGRSGSPAFDPPFYFSLYPELQNAFGQNNFRLATDHWIQNGIEEGRTGSVAFDPFFYLSAHPDVEANVGERNYREALLHWFKYGINEGRRASWFYDPVAYMQHNPDVAAAFGATNYKIGLFHYMRYGRFEGRRATP